MIKLQLIHGVAAFHGLGPLETALKRAPICLCLKEVLPTPN